MIRYALHYAASMKGYRYQILKGYRIKYRDFMKILSENGAEPNLTDENGATLVHCAAANEGEEAHKKLKLLNSFS